MAEFKIEKAYRNAVARWAKVVWPVGRFGEHVESIRSCNVEPVYMEDLYLAGAAGWRIDSAWEVIDAEFSGRLKRCVSSLPLADMTADDVWSEMLTKIIDEDNEREALPDGRQPAKIIRYQGLVKLLNYFIVIAKRIAIQRNRKKKPDSFFSMLDGLEKATPSNTESPDKMLVTKDTLEIVFNRLAEAYESLTTEQRFLIMMVYRKGMLQKQAGKLLGWSESKTARQIKKGIELIKSRLADTDGFNFSQNAEKAFSALWQRAWRQ